MAGILITHNQYRSTSPSGENIAVERQRELLTSAGFAVQSWSKDSDELVSVAPFARMLAALRLAGSLTQRRAFTQRLVAARIAGASVVHLHNPWPLFTYDVALAAHDAGLPLVQTLHNYRLFGTNNRLVKGGTIRRAQNVSEMFQIVNMANNHGRLANVFYNHALNLWWRRGIPQTAVDRYVCLTAFQQRLAIAAGIPGQRTVVVPNFLHHQGPIGNGPGNYVLFVGRLDKTKGIDRLMRWWPLNGPPLRIVGDGPLANIVVGHPNITYMGRQPFPMVQRLMSEARYVLLTSTWYEGFPLVILEAFAAGTPCMVPDLGGLPEIVSEGKTGAVYQSSNDQEAVDAACRLWDIAPTMRASCRAEYEEKYTSERHLSSLRKIYAEISP